MRIVVWLTLPVPDRNLAASLHKGVVDMYRVLGTVAFEAEVEVRAILTVIEFSPDRLGSGEC
jgi:hypothetical protein